MPPFVHLHVHTEMSLLDGLARIKDLIAKAKEHNMEALAITDHGTMSGAMHFYDAARAQGLKPIIGCEIYVAAESLKARDKNNYHLILLAENETGYHNLLRLVSTASLEGFYYKPRVDLALLQEHHEGLIALSACLQGEVTAKLVAGQREEAREAAQRLAGIFGENNFYLELMDHGLPLQREVNPHLISLAREVCLPLVVTNDVHYVNQDDAYAQEVLLCIQTGTTIDDPKRMKMETDQFYLRSGEEMAGLFPEVPEAAENTACIAGRCNLELKFKGFHLPHFRVPEGHSEESYLEERCAAGLKERFGQPAPEIEERLRYELGVINRMGFASYFLVVSDFVAHAKTHGVLVGPGRGSAAGSIVSYVLGITTVNPLEHGLIFERFLNPDRISMPDVDIDFDDRRDEVIRYVTEKYGGDHVAQIITFGTMAAKAAIRDVGRALGLPYGEVDRVAKLIPFNSSIAEALKNSPELRSLHDTTDYVQRLLETSQRLEGVSRHASTHAAGVVISRDPLVEHVPLARATRGEAVTQYPMDVLEKIGLLKMDFLGLSTLTILGRAVEIVNLTEGVSLDLDHIPMDDPAIYELLSRGETVGIFQLEGSFTTRMTLDVKPTCFNDVVALMALIRPGPMTMAPLYIQRKHGQVPIEYPHPDMEPILKETYGVALYQEQIMRIANVLSGYTMSEADALRKAMGKKLPEEMKKHRSRFVSGAKQHGLSKALADEIFEMIERFAGYGFNKAHSVAYAVIACQTAFFKARYPEAYMTGLLTSETGNTDKIVTGISECRRLGIAVLPPDVNRSEVSFTIDRDPGNPEKKAIRFGLGAVKNVGEGAIEAIIAGRQNLPGQRFSSLEEFCQTIDLRQVNRRALESLVKCGAMDSLGRNRTQLLDSLDGAVSVAQDLLKAREAGQMAMFDALPAGEAPQPANRLDGVEPAETSHKVLLAWEKEMLGIYVSEHPLSRVLAKMGNNLMTTGKISEELAGQKIVLVGMLTTLRRLITKKKNQTMLVATVEDLEGTVEMVAFPDCYERHSDVWQEDAIIRIEGKVDQRNETLQIICESVTLLQSEGNSQEPESTSTSSPPSFDGAKTVLAPRPTGQNLFHLRISLHASENLDADIKQMQALDKILRQYPGQSKVTLRLFEGDDIVSLEPLFHRVDYSEELEDEILQLLGEGAIRVDELDPNEDNRGYLPNGLRAS